VKLPLIYHLWSIKIKGEAKEFHRFQSNRMFWANVHQINEHGTIKYPQILVKKENTLDCPMALAPYLTPRLLCTFWCGAAMTDPQQVKHTAFVPFFCFWRLAVSPCRRRVSHWVKCVVFCTVFMFSEACSITTGMVSGSLWNGWDKPVRWQVSRTAQKQLQNLAGLSVPTSQGGKLLQRSRISTIYHWGLEISKIAFHKSN
jgi:hypothetical protein